MMKVPNFASELDVMKQHLEAGDEVFVIACQEDLNSCLVNGQHWKSICYQCQSRFQRGMDLLHMPKDHILPFLKNVDYSVLPATFNSIKELLQYSILGINLGEGVVASVAAVLKDHDFDTIQHRALIRQKLEMSYLVTLTIQHYLEAIQPEKVYLYNGRLAETKPVMASCIKAGIDAYAVERAGTQGKYELYKNASPLDIDYWTQDFNRLWAQNPTGKRDALGEQFYVERRHGQDQGDTSFTKKQMANFLPEDFDSSKKNIGIFITSEYELAGYPDRDNPIYTDQNTAIRQLSESLLSNPDIVLWVRMHPNITFSKNTQLLELQEMARQEIPNLKIIWPDSKVDTYALVDHVDTVLTFGSTVGIEATYWGTPSVLAGKAYYEHFDVCHIAHSHEELLNLLQTPLENKDKLGALIYGHGLMTNGYPFQTFIQTELHEGNFLGESFQNETFWKRQKTYLLRKMDKFQTKKKAKKA
jgi:hypothetical protein